ncbi:nuclear pore complex protein NUP62-like [Varroa destructor]|uniref:Uncharacterized protein n=1 Tax=Varroa destructor TaxID=109461 RepID=A0A7M7JFG3_VARDE|nr:nuclear pore complex protein NUP62-like [Varroa destructor]
MMVTLLCTLAVALCAYAGAESTLKSSPSTPTVPADLSASLSGSSFEDEAAFRQAVGSTLGSLGFGNSVNSQGPFQSSGGAAASSYQPAYNALNSVYGITYHGDYNQLANYLQTGGPGRPGLGGKPNQKPTISSRFRNFMNSLFFRRSNKHPPAFAQPLPNAGASFGYGPSGAGNYPDFGSAGLGTAGGASGVPSPFGAFPATASQGQYDFSTLVGSSSSGTADKGQFGDFGSTGLAGLSSVSTTTSFGPPGSSTSFGAASPGSFVSSASNGGFGASSAFSPSSGTSSFSTSGSSGGFNRFGSSAGVGSGATYFPGETSQTAAASSSVYNGAGGSAFGKGIEDSKSSEDKDAKDDQD